MNIFKVFGIHKANDENFKFDSYGEQIGDLPDEANPQWDAHAIADADHSWAMDQGWAGGKPNEDEFHPETGEYGGVGNTAHHVKEWTKGLQEKHGLSLVNDNDEPVDAVYDHHGFDEEPINHTHITDYIKAKTGKTETFPGAVEGEQFDVGESDDDDFEFSLADWAEGEEPLEPIGDGRRRKAFYRELLSRQRRDPETNIPYGPLGGQTSDLHPSTDRANWAERYAHRFGMRNKTSEMYPYHPETDEEGDLKWRPVPNKPDTYVPTWIQNASAVDKMLWKMFGLKKEDNLPYNMSKKQYETAWAHFTDVLVHPSNSGYTHDEDGRVIPSVTDEETPKDQQAREQDEEEARTKAWSEMMPEEWQDEHPEEATQELNIRKAWHHFLGAVGPWYARGLYGKVHRLPHEASSDDTLSPFDPAARDLRYEPHPERHLRQSDYSAPNQWHSREQFEQSMPGQEHPNEENEGHYSDNTEEGRAIPEGERVSHNQVHDNHWFGSHRYWGPYTEHWLKNGSDAPDFGGHKVTVDNGAEGYHPDIYAKYGGKNAQALPFLDQKIIDRHLREDEVRNIYGPDPEKWPDDAYNNWAGEGTSVYHHPLDYKNKYWKDAAPRSREQRPDQPGDYFPLDVNPPEVDYGFVEEDYFPSDFDPNEWENKMNKMLWKAFGIRKRLLPTHEVILHSEKNINEWVRTRGKHFRTRRRAMAHAIDHVKQHPDHSATIQHNLANQSEVGAGGRTRLHHIPGGPAGEPMQLALSHMSHGDEVNDIVEGLHDEIGGSWIDDPRMKAAWVERDVAALDKMKDLHQASLPSLGDTVMHIDTRALNSLPQEGEMGTDQPPYGVGEELNKMLWKAFGIHKVEEGEPGTGTPEDWRHPYTLDLNSDHKVARGTTRSAMRHAVRHMKINPNGHVVIETPDKGKYMMRHATHAEGGKLTLTHMHHPQESTDLFTNTYHDLWQAQAKKDGKDFNFDEPGGYVDINPMRQKQQNISTWVARNYGGQFQYGADEDHLDKQHLQQAARAGDTSTLNRMEHLQKNANVLQGENDPFKLHINTRGLYDLHPDDHMKHMGFVPENPKNMMYPH